MNHTEPTRTRQQGTLNTNSNNDPTVKIAAVRAIVAAKQYAKIDGIMVDLFSASAIIAVYDALSPERQTKMASLPIRTMALLALKLIK